MSGVLVWSVPPLVLLLCGNHVFSWTVFDGVLSLVLEDAADLFNFTTLCIGLALMPSCKFRVPIARVGLGVTGEITPPLSDKEGSTESLLAGEMPSIASVPGSALGEEGE